jgi:phosphoglycolate phosphatase-like HAD superfamily hydrolase
VSAPPPRTGSPAPPTRPPERGVVLFDLDGTLLDDLGLISDVAADVLFRSFGTPPEEGRVHYLATTGMPFEAQLAQLYPDAPKELRASASRLFHQRKITEAYAKAEPFPEVPKLLKALAGAGWNLAITTGSETQMAELLLEREGLRYWFDDVLGSAEGTKREHLAEYRRRYGPVPMFLVGDSRFDLEAARSADGVIPLGRASAVRGWTLTPRDLRAWGAAWASLSLADLPRVLDRLSRTPSRARPPTKGRSRS